MHYTPAAGKDFWSDRIALVCDKMLPLQLSILKDEAPDTEPSHAIENFEIAAGLKHGEFYGMVFQDSDVGKWIEGVAYKLMLQPDAALEAEVDRIVDIIEKAQQPDGYLNTYFTVKEPGKRWTNLQECHELYCAGHLMEGAAAYFSATGKRKFLDIMCRMADHIDTMFGPEEGKLKGYPGHPEVELGLYHLYKVTGEQRYLKLAKYFIDERGSKPCYFDEEWEKRGHTEHFGGMRALGLEYMQAHAPVREQKDAVGHAVRALYLFAAMADVAVETKDESLWQACERLWDSAVNRKMYITGGFGATSEGEAFMSDYELPNDTIYAETCASIAAVFFGQAMLRKKRDGKIADTIERILYNGMLSGMSLAADKFYYVNPLEVVDKVSGEQPGYKHVLPTRPKWFACACCPPNMARLIPSLPQYCYQDDGDEITIHQYLGGKIELEKATFTLTTQYPWVGKLSWHVDAKQPVTVYLRVPGWAEGADITLDGKKIAAEMTDGYAKIALPEGSSDLVMDIKLTAQCWYAHPYVRQDAGCVAFTYGPVVYCFEGVDNPQPLSTLRVYADGMSMGEYDPELLGGVRPMHVKGLKVESVDGALYSRTAPKTEPITLNAIPYYAWANRGKKDMRVWMVEA